MPVLFAFLVVWSTETAAFAELIGAASRAVACWTQVLRGWVVRVLFLLHVVSSAEIVDFAELTGA